MSTVPSPTAARPATLDDLARVDGKAELVAGRIVHFMPTGFLPGQVAGEIYVLLKLHVKASGRGYAFTDNAGFAVPGLASGRQSFSPDVSYYEGPVPANPMRFIDGPPTFAVEVRSEGDYGPSAEAEMAAKRGDYFEAGTLVVWDVDPRDRVVRSYHAEAPAVPVVSGPGAFADAGGAVPGWRVAVDAIGL